MNISRSAESIGQNYQDLNLHSPTPHQIQHHNLSPHDKPSPNVSGQVTSGDVMVSGESHYGPFLMEG